MKHNQDHLAHFSVSKADLERRPAFDLPSWQAERCGEAYQKGQTDMARAMAEGERVLVEHVREIRQERDQLEEHAQELQAELRKTDTRLSALKDWRRVSAAVLLLVGLLLGQLSAGTSWDPWYRDPAGLVTLPTRLEGLDGTAHCAHEPRCRTYSQHEHRWRFPDPTVESDLAWEDGSGSLTVYGAGGEQALELLYDYQEQTFLVALPAWGEGPEGLAYCWHRPVCHSVGEHKRREEADTLRYEHGTNLTLRAGDNDAGDIGELYMWDADAVGSIRFVDSDNRGGRQ